MTLHDTQEFRRFDVMPVREKNTDRKESTDDFLARGGKIVQVASGVGCDSLIVPSKQSDGSYKNDAKAQDISRRKPKVMGESILSFAKTGRTLGPSGRMYIRAIIREGETLYRSLIRGVSQSAWDADIKIAIEARNKSLLIRGEPIPD